jgi:3-dehydroquinate synthase class II
MSMQTAKYSLCKEKSKLEGNIVGNGLQRESILSSQRVKINKSLMLIANAEAAGVLQQTLLANSKAFLLAERILRH